MRRCSYSGLRELNLYSIYPKTGITGKLNEQSLFEGQWSPLSPLAPVFRGPMKILGVDAHLSPLHSLLGLLDEIFVENDDVLSFVILKRQPERENLHEKKQQLWCRRMIITSSQLISVLIEIKFIDSNNDSNGVYIRRHKCDKPFFHRLGDPVRGKHHQSI